MLDTKAILGLSIEHLKKMRAKKGFFTVAIQGLSTGPVEPPL